MNQEQNNFNNQNFNNGMMNNQPLPNNQNLNNQFNPNVNVNQSTFNQQSINHQPQSTVSYQQPINQVNMQQPAPQSVNTFESGNINNQNFNSKPPKKLNIGLIVGIVVAIVAIIAVIIIFLNNDSSSENKLKEDPTVSSASFEQSGDYYVLKDESGKILLDNIKYYGDLYTKGFCNGTTKITTTDGKVGIINDKGKFIAELGKYKYITQTGCYYKVTNYDDEIKVKILNYDGSVFFEDINDKYLDKSSIECAVNYCFSKKVALFSTNGKYQLLDSKGKVIKEYEKITGVDKPKVSSKIQDEEKDRYISSFYNGKTDIIDTKNNKIITSLNDEYYVKDINSNNENQVIIYKNNGVDRHAIIYNNGKKSFDTTSCLNIAFVNGEVRCLIQNGGVFEYYDVNGKKLDK